MSRYINEKTVQFISRGFGRNTYTITDRNMNKEYVELHDETGFNGSAEAIELIKQFERMEYAEYLEWHERQSFLRGQAPQPPKYEWIKEATHNG